MTSTKPSLDEMVSSFTSRGRKPLTVERSTPSRSSAVFGYCIPVTLFIVLICLAIYAARELGLNVAIEKAAIWASSQGLRGEVLFITLIALLMMSPIPFTPVMVATGAVLSLFHALRVLTVGRQIGTCGSFLLSRSVFRTYFESIISSRPTMRLVKGACAKEQWKITFLSRFSPLPIQVKNYCWGVLPVSFECFFWCSLFADSLHTLCSVYVGALGSHLATTAGGTDSEEVGYTLWLGFGVTLCAMILATVVGRKIYLEALSAADTDQVAVGDFEEASTIGIGNRERGWLESHRNPLSQYSRSRSKPIIQEL